MSNPGAASSSTSGQDAYDLSVDPEIAALSDAELKSLRDSLSTLIAKRIDGIQYAETRRGQLAAIGGSLAPIGLAFIPLALGTTITSLRAGYIFLGASLALLGIAVWWLYMRQTNYNYPWLGSATNWKWFYHGALPDKNKFGPDCWVGHSKLGRRAEADAAETQWHTFAKQAKGLANDRVDATQDLRQLYLLHLNERYKNLFLTDMRKLLSRGLIVSALIAVIAGVVAQYVIHPPPNSSEVDSNGLKARARWSVTGAVRGEGLSSRDVEYRTEVTIVNQSDRDMRGSRLIAHDCSGTPLPTEFVVTPSLPTDVPKGQTITVNGHFWIASSDADDLCEIRAE
ncbi:hypothetical protein [Mycobacterium sp. 29Ha]|uniref:hypothetical protein n=1 Tax=Mycobacterium sp. 29Ha TaxID=2939268 RepID=UPI002938E8BB|nr:hypothetical protein [Mycobacterium sp. 29Ha]MDV3135975.1 hypothetical protein [Mycobacterium sp. 29Ha]